MLTQSLARTMRILRICLPVLPLISATGCPNSIVTSVNADAKPASGSDAARSTGDAGTAGAGGHDSAPTESLDARTVDTSSASSGRDAIVGSSLDVSPADKARDALLADSSNAKSDATAPKPDAGPDRVPAQSDSGSVVQADRGGTSTQTDYNGGTVTPGNPGDPNAVALSVEPPPAVIDCTHRGSGRDFPVGPGQKYTKIGDVPWYDLGPGDTVRIFWRADPYKEKILISNRGTAEQPIRVCGVAGSDGSLPVLSGDGATSGPNLHFINYPAIQDEGLILINRDSSDSYYSRPGYIVIEGLALRSAYRDYSYTATDGSVRKWGDGAASVSVIGADHVTIRRCELSDSGYGLFTLAKSEVEQALVREVLLEGCTIFGNGVVGQYLEHNVYSQALGMVAQFNRFGRLRAGSQGANLKDRSAGTVVRYNYIEGSVRLLDLVDAQEHVDDALKDPRYRQTLVYGNVLISGPNDAGALIHYGGDTEGFEQNFRKGTLYFYNNTVLESANSSDIWNTMLVNASTNDEHVDLRNNIIRSTGTTYFHLLGSAGQAVVGANWLSTGYLPALDGSATVTVGADVITGSDPKLDANTLRPLAGSPVIDRGVALAAEAAGNPVSFEYASSAQGAPRLTKGSASDFGAFEAGQ